MLIRRSQWVETPWRNGAGSSFAIWTGTSGEFPALQIFRTPIRQAAPFSDYSGCNRIFVLLEGSSLELAFNGQTRRVHSREIIRFAGETAVRADLPEGPVEVLNVIFDRMQWREAQDGETAHLFIAHMLGTAHGHALAQGDTILSAEPPAGHPDQIEIRLMKIA